MPALITPFAAAGDIDFDAHRHNVQALEDMGVEGFLIAGSNGEGPYLDPGERHELVTATREELGDETFILCGVAAQSLRQAQAQLAEAQDSGADAALVLTPTTLVRGNDHAVRGFFEDLADWSPLPILLYAFQRGSGGYAFAQGHQTYRFHQRQQPMVFQV